MRVLYISTKGGIHDYRFLEKLVKNHTVLFLHYSPKPMIDEIKNLPDLTIVVKKPILGANPVLSHLSHFKKIVKEFKADLIHSGYVWQVGILPALIDFHPHLSMVWGSDVLTEPDKNPLIKLLVNKVLTQCDHIQCDAEIVKEKMISDFGIKGDKVTVFPWGIDLNLFKPMNKIDSRKHINTNQNDFTVIFTRALEAVYDISTMINGFKLFAENKPDVRLLIASDGSQKELLMSQINSESMKKISFKGWIKNSELPNYFNAADVYLSTSLSDGSSLALLEAMATGKGIVVTDLPANHEWIKSGENGIIIPVRDPERVCHALDAYYFNRELIKKHGDININIAKERADWDKNYKKLEEIYKKI